MKILCLKLCCILTNTINVRDIVLFASVRTADILNCVSEVMQSTVRATVRLAVSESCSCRSIGSFWTRTAAVTLAVSGQELQTVFNNLFITFPARLRVEGGHFQELLLHAVSYILYEEM
jgi:hypothetical protein